ncbi:response regulator [Myceligenerans indicum]|uniref:Response regulator n=1 Tax=Myceligenerans indicum TaxID=2593663 RepID=A0ABS1LQA6_9MICO|nr:response regulator [Myceligenerans indicum]MBL0887717.1 response regulator [Myceligenerans indicum]
MNRRILVVDDDEAIREVVRAGLSTIPDWDIVLAASGPQAIDLCRSDPPDAVLLDVMMPVMDGPTTFAHLQEDPRTHDIPVILLTAKVQPAERRKYEDLAVAGVLAKPFDPIALPRNLAALLEWSI